MERKRDFIRLLEKAIHADKARNNVRSVIYTKDPHNAFPEIITIKWEGGQKMSINVTGNSNGMNAREVIHAIYGGGQVAGRIPAYMTTKSAAEAAQLNNHLQSSMAGQISQERS